MQVYGIDLSKEKFDVNFIDAKGKEKNQEVKNTIVSVSKFLSYVSRDGIVCAEHTGGLWRFVGLSVQPDDSPHRSGSWVYNQA